VYDPEANVLRRVFCRHLCRFRGCCPACRQMTRRRFPRLQARIIDRSDVPGESRGPTKASPWTDRMYHARAERRVRHRHPLDHTHQGRTRSPENIVRVTKWRWGSRPPPPQRSGSKGRCSRDAPPGVRETWRRPSSLAVLPRSSRLKRSKSFSRTAPQGC